MSEVTIGVLALQGAFREHIAAFTGLRCRTVEVRTAAQLAECDGLVLPGGESTAISLIAQRTGMVRTWVGHDSLVGEECDLLVLCCPVGAPVGVGSLWAPNLGHLRRHE